MLITGARTDYYSTCHNSSYVILLITGRPESRTRLGPPSATRSTPCDTRGCPRCSTSSRSSRTRIGSSSGKAHQVRPPHNRRVMEAVIDESRIVHRQSEESISLKRAVRILSECLLGYPSSRITSAALRLSSM